MPPTSAASAKSSKSTPDFAAALADNIIRWADDYANELTIAKRRLWKEQGEADLLARFEATLYRALERYRPPIGFALEMRLAFQLIYDATVLAPLALPPGEADELEEASESALAQEDRDAALLAALMASLVEATSALRLTRKLTERLAGILTDLGRSLCGSGFPLHAATAFTEASRLYRDIDEHSREDDCRYEEADARRLAMPHGPKRLFRTLSKWLVGYSYRPFRLLWWILGELVASGVLLESLPSRDESRYQTAFVAMQNLINPMGVSDTDKINHAAWIFLTIESYAGAITTDVFFALLIAKWWRK